MKIEISGICSNYMDNVEIRMNLINSILDTYTIHKIYPKEFLDISNKDMRERIFDEMVSIIKEEFMNSEIKN